MNIIEWSSEYHVGVQLLDDQHKQIVTMINQLGSHAESDVRSEVISDLLNKLTQYATEHFKTEEKLLESHGYPYLAAQIEEHREYRFKIATLCNDTALRKSTVPAELLQYLFEWWVNHILESDMAFKEYLTVRGVK